jgi:hypothetical protein
MGRTSGLPKDCLIEAWPSVRALFATLYLEEGPLSCEDGLATGIPFLEYLDECVEERRLGRKLAERVAKAFLQCAGLENSRDTSTT